MPTTSNATLPHHPASDQCMAMVACTTTREPQAADEPRGDQASQRDRQYEMMRGQSVLRFNANLQDLCEIPYDRTTLPLLSPDGRFIATVIGPSPSTPTRLAEPGASTARHLHRGLADRQNPTGCSVVYRLDRRSSWDAGRRRLLPGGVASSRRVPVDRQGRMGFGRHRLARRGRHGQRLCIARTQR